MDDLPLKPLATFRRALIAILVVQFVLSFAAAFFAFNDAWPNLALAVGPILGLINLGYLVMGILWLVNAWHNAELQQDMGLPLGAVIILLLIPVVNLVVWFIFGPRLIRRSGGLVRAWFYFWWVTVAIASVSPVATSFLIRDSDSAPELFGAGLTIATAIYTLGHIFYLALIEKLQMESQSPLPSLAHLD